MAGCAESLEQRRGATRTSDEELLDITCIVQAVGASISMPG